MSFVADLATFSPPSIFLFWGGLHAPPYRHVPGHQISNCNFSGHKQQLIMWGQGCRSVSLPWQETVWTELRPRDCAPILAMKRGAL